MLTFSSYFGRRVRSVRLGRVGNSVIIYVEVMCLRTGTCRISSSIYFMISSRVRRVVTESLFSLSSS